MLKYKVGDKVKCIEGGVKGSGWKLDRSFTIREVTCKSDINPIYWPVEEFNGSQNGVFQDSLILLQKKYEFEAGDKVKLRSGYLEKDYVGHKNNWKLLEYNTTYTIETVGEYSYFTSPSSSIESVTLCKTDYRGWCPAEMFTRVIEAEVMTSEFKEGMLVEVKPVDKNYEGNGECSYVSDMHRLGGMRIMVTGVTPTRIYAGNWSWLPEWLTIVRIVATGGAGGGSMGCGGGGANSACKFEGIPVTNISNKDKKKPLMTRLNNFMKKLLDADTQALIKAGYINGDLELTCNGREALEFISFNANKAELVTMANEKIADEEKEAKK